MLETARLWFRPYRVDDFLFYLSLWQDPDVVRFIGSGEVHEKAHLKMNYPYWLSRSELGKGVLVMVLKATQQPVGHAGLVPIEIDGRLHMELGYWVAKRHWGRGLATEAALFFRNLAFEQLHQSEIVSLIQPNNVRSIRVAQKIGMQHQRDTVFRGTLVHLYAMDIRTYRELPHEDQC
ncbi:GNAT family N-acetyltransferase [Alicyclobacillus fastidiosus]|uniref:GNAT family N-acetyltransferase n=1 Tax=Alicyclobacillus fastidiosus TaxID=392011 RepID=A0ABY6ZNA1_9BACL|nr:GNAT family N-acetyltransferase [Alicyclobacillus fastidiosus]WAH43656.1 GNAT family N-acetyltransferase [Alicyclobacillus fastidiosus]GMA59856.1 acetyltransferase [Alicyclobacillus fastidiosus]